MEINLWWDGKCVGNGEDYNTIKEMDDWVKRSDCERWIRSEES